MAETQKDRGGLVIISSPSGAGKTTLARRLLAEFPALRFSVSHTTRKPRNNEINGVDYVFVHDSEFARAVAAGEFAEWAQVHGNRYGTARAAVEEALESGVDMVFDVDWQGGRALAEQWPADSVKIFVLPPDLATLEDRLRRRATDAEEDIRRRLATALKELQYHGEYEHVIINENLDRAYRFLRAIYLVSRARRGCGNLDAARAELDAARNDNQRGGGHEHAESLIEAGRRRRL